MARSNTKTHKGVFKPINFKKYKGNPTNIIYRSMWECQFMRWLDKNNDVLEWSSEEVIVEYISPIDNKKHRYFPDFVFKAKTRDNAIKTFMVEIKPKKQTVEPVKGKKKEKTFLYEVKTYAINKSKWESATEYCRKKGWHFKIITEDHIFNNGNQIQ